jgi:hypothetical protein
MHSPTLTAALIAARLVFAYSARTGTSQDSGDTLTLLKSYWSLPAGGGATTENASHTSAKNSLKSAVCLQTEHSTAASASAPESRANDAEHEAASVQQLKAKLKTQLRLCHRLFHDKGKPEVQQILKGCEVREPDSAELAVLDLVVAGCVAILEFDLHDSTISPKTEDEDSDSLIDTFLERILEDCRSSIPASQYNQSRY